MAPDRTPQDDAEPQQPLATVLAGRHADDDLRKPLLEQQQQQQQGAAGDEQQHHAEATPTTTVLGQLKRCAGCRAGAPPLT